MARKRKNQIGWGEWWIDDSGSVQAADGDVGDVNHAMAALDSILGEYGINLEEEPDAPVIEPMHLSASDRYWLRKKGVPADVVKALNESDPRELMIEKKGWIRLAGTSAEMWKFDDATLDALRSGLFDAWQFDEEDLAPGGADEDTEITIEEAKTRKTWHVPARALLDERYDAASLRRLGLTGKQTQAKSGEFLEGAWGEKAARERGLENPTQKEVLFSYWNAILPKVKPRCGSRDRTYWHSGGCWILAEAIRRIVGGKIVVMTSIFGIEHFFNQIGNISFDARFGPLPNEQFRAAWTDIMVRESGRKPSFHTLTDKNRKSISEASAADLPYDVVIQETVEELFEAMDAATRRSRNPMSEQKTPPPEAEKPIRRQCAWCRAVFVQGEWMPHEAIVPKASHGICPDCLEKIEGKKRARR